MNVLNKGRCSRCLASEMKEKIVQTDIVDGIAVSKSSMWRFCRKKNNYCRYCSRNCREGPMGIKI